MSSSPTLDPVCGRPVDPLRARAVGIFGGTTYYFCSPECKARYADPRSPLTIPESHAPSLATSATSQKPDDRGSELLVERRTPARFEAVSAHAPMHEEEPPAVLTPKRSALPLVIGAIVVVGLGAVIASRRTEAPRPIAPSVVVAPKPAPLVPKVAPKPPVVPTYADLVAPLKLGMRRFVGPGATPTASVQLLVIDATDRATPIRIAELAGADPASADTSDAIAPEPAFASASTAEGSIFSTSLVAGNVRVDVRVVRRAEGVVAETSNGAEPWHDAALIPLLADAQVRAAAFARKRYLTEEKP